MVRDNYRAGEERGNRKTITQDDLPDSQTLSSDRWVELFSVQADKTLKYFPGYGSPDRRGNVGFADFDAEADGSGTGLDGDAIQGDLRWEVYNDSQKDDLAAVGPTMRTEDLRSAVSADRTEKVMMPMQGIGTPEDGYLVLAIKVDSGSDGTVLEDTDTGHSGSVLDIGIPYTQERIRT